jgi:sodium pump decarboxylase gamma subunit
MVYSALELTVVGMTVVFVFLVIMVGTMQVMSYVVQKYFPEEKKAVQAALIPEDNTLIAAIAVAVKNRK